MAYNPDLYTQIVKSHHIPSDALENTTCLKRFCSKHALPNLTQPSSLDPAYQVESVFIPYGHIIFACFQTSPSTTASHWTSNASPNTPITSAQNAYLSSPSPGSRLFASQFEGGSPSDPLSNINSLSGPAGHLGSALFGTGGSSQCSPSSALNSPLVIPSLPSLSPFLKHAVPGQITISSAQASPAMSSGPLRGQTASSLSQSTLYHPYKTNGGATSTAATPSSATAANLPLPEAMQESLSFLSDYKIGEHDRTRGDSAGGRSTSGSSDTQSQSMWHASTPHPAIAAMVGHALSPSSPSFQRSVGIKDTKSHDRHKPSLDGSLSGNERERKIQKVSASPRHPAHDAVIRKKSMSSTSTGSASPPSQRDLDSSELSGQEYGGGGGVMRIQQEEKACESCGTTNSPEWRRGQSGKKDLCNACGLRYSRSVARLNRQAQKQLDGKTNGKVKGPKAGKNAKSGTKKSGDQELSQDQQQQPQQHQQQQHQQHQQQPQQQHLQQQQQQQQQPNNTLQHLHQQFQQHSSNGAFPSMFTTTPVPPPTFYPGS